MTMTEAHKELLAWMKTRPFFSEHHFTQKDEGTYVCEMILDTGSPLSITITEYCDSEEDIYVVLRYRNLRRQLKFYEGDYFTENYDLCDYVHVALRNWRQWMQDSVENSAV